MTREAVAESDGDRPEPSPRRRRVSLRGVKNALRAARDALRGGVPSLLGLLSVMLLYAGLFGLDFLFGADLRVFGVTDADTERIVFARYGRLIAAHQVRILLTYLLVSFIVGGLAQILITLWQRSGVWPRHRRAHSASTPVHVTPSPWPLGRRILMSLGIGLFVHLFMLGRAIALRPSLFTEALYDRGGLLRALMVSITHGSGLWLGLTAVLGCALFSILAPISTPRGRRFFAELSTGRLVVGLGVASVLLGGLLYTFAGGSSVPSPVAAVKPKRPSVLLIAVDSLRADRVGGAASKITPTLSSLAERSVAFDAAHVTVPRTFPSLVTLLTGRYPHRHGIRTMFPTLTERAAVPPALPRLLKPLGYKSAALSDFCGEVFSRIDLGFDRTLVPAFDARTIVLQRSLTVHKNILPYVLGPNLSRLFPELEALAEMNDASRLADQAVSLLAEYQRQGAPFFMTVFFSSAHFPYAAPSPYYRRFTDPSYRGPFRYHKPPLSEPQSDADRAQVRALYDSALRAADDGVRKLLEGLKKLKLDDNTIVVVLADHGENLYDEPERGMGHGEHLEGDHALRVPLIIYDPVHRFAPRHVPGLVRDIDLVPTLLGLVDAPLDGGGPEVPALDGVKLQPLLDGSAQDLGLSAFHETELWFTASGPGFSARQRLPYPGVPTTTDVDEHDDIALAPQYADLVTVAKHRALRTDRYKIIYRPTREGPRYSLFDIVSDPRELHDLSTERPAELLSMQAALFRIVGQDPNVVIERGYILPR